MDVQSSVWSAGRVQTVAPVSSEVVAHTLSEQTLSTSGVLVPSYDAFIVKLSVLYSVLSIDNVTYKLSKAIVASLPAEASDSLL